MLHALLEEDAHVLLRTVRQRIQHLDRVHSPCRGRALIVQRKNQHPYVLQQELSEFIQRQIGLEHGQALYLELLVAIILHHQLLHHLEHLRNQLRIGYLPAALLLHQTSEAVKSIQDHVSILRLGQQCHEVVEGTESDVLCDIIWLAQF